MYKTDKERNDAIQRSARTFDLNSQVSADLAEEYLGVVGGEADVSSEPEEDFVMPLEEAASLIDGAENPAFQYFLNDIIGHTMKQYVAKSEDLKTTTDSRSTYATMALALKQVTAIWATKIHEATQRVQRATPEEKRHVSPKVKRVINVGPSSTESKTDGFVSADGQEVYTLPGMNVVAAEFQPKH